MMYRGPGFLSVVRFGSHAILSSLFCQQVVSYFSVFCVLPLTELTEGRGAGVGGWGGAKFNDGEKAWSFVNHSILSGYGYIL
jgi:hypothetical protein